MPKADFSQRDFYDVWLPNLSPREELLKQARQSQNEPRAWKAFERQYRAEMNRSEPARLLDLLAALSRQTNFSVGCYCANEERCHRSILKKLLADRGASFS